MRKFSIVLFMIFAVFSIANASGRTRVKVHPINHDIEVLAHEEDTIMKLFVDSLNKLVNEYLGDDANKKETAPTYISPYFYQMIVPGTFYQEPVRQAMVPTWQTTDDRGGHLVSDDVINDQELSLLYFSRQALGSMYTFYPNLVTKTEADLVSDGKVMEDVDIPIKYEKELKNELSLSELEQEEIGEVQAIVRKPNFWKFKGSNSLNLTQNYATDNWFQGKANYYNLLGIVNVEANYDNKRKVQWDNRLDLQLGFQTNPDNEYQKFKPTNNLVRLNSKLGIKAAKNWNYALSVKAESQLVPNNNYDKNGKKNCITDFLSPLNVDVALGIDWKWNKKRFSGSLMMAPGTYNFKYVDRLDLATRYLGGDMKDHHAKHTFGPSATARYNWKIANNISWDSRLYWITNLHYTNIEYENTITFSINKYLTSKFYFYPRFNDSSKKNRMPDDDGNHTGTYWMFKEWLSMGVSYSW